MIKGDKIKLVKPMGVFTNVGEVCEVTDIKEDGVICFRFGGVHLGCMSYDEYEKYFEQVEEKSKRKWGKWRKCGYQINVEYSYGLEHSIVDDRIGVIEYRTNKKRVQVRACIKDKTVKASSTCCDEDTFDFRVGVELALKRLFPKILAYFAECDAKEI